MKFTSKEFLYVQAAIIILLLVTMDGIIRGPMHIIKTQIENQQHLTAGIIYGSQKGERALEIIEYGRLFERCNER